MAHGNFPPVDGVVISAIRFLTNQVENAALQAYWEDRNRADDIYAAMNAAIEALNGMRTADMLASCPWPCPPGKRCAPNC